MSIWKLLFSFKGRINRRTYWYVFIVDLICFVIFVWMWIIPEYKYVIFFGRFGGWGFYRLFMIFRLLTLLVGMPISIWSGHATMVKRLHDRDRSGWWTLMSFVPGVGPFWLFIECGFRKGTNGLNSYGSDPNVPKSELESWRQTRGL